MKDARLLDRLILDDQQKQLIKAHVMQLEEQLQILLNISSKEKMKSIRPGKRALAFTKFAIDQALVYPNVIPRAIDVTKLSDLQSINEYFRGIEQSIALISKTIADTRFHLDSVLFGNALNIYQQFKMAQYFDISGTKAVYEEMRKNFKVTSSVKELESPMEPPGKEDA